MKSFLERVAETYLATERDAMGDYCFVFPNKRSGTFFSHFLRTRSSGKRFIFPEIKTISEFVAGFSPLVEASRYEQLFILYNEYRKLSADISDFDKFLFWGDMLIADFNDVDRYLVDPRSLFTNVRDIKEINSTYLTEEQMEIIREFWGEETPTKHIERFWTHISGGEEKEGDSRDKFRKLWEILYPLFTAYRKELKARGLSTNGMYYRNAARRLGPKEDIELPFRRYIFVGFNVLSTSELKIFSALQKRGAADFYWDFNSPAFATPHNRATRFIAANAAHFPSLHDLGEDPIKEFPKISIVGIPSNSGQAKYAGRQLSEWLAEGKVARPEDAVDTAIVLPDESLFLPMVHSVPKEITSLNITMGFPLRHTPMAAVLKNVVSLQMRSRPVRGSLCFFHEDVSAVISLPAIRNAAPDECRELEAQMKATRRFMIDAAATVSQFPKLAKVFACVDRENPLDGARSYLTGLIDFLLDGLLQEESQDNGADSSREEEADESETRKPARADAGLHILFLQACRRAVESLYDAARGFSVEMRHSTFFRLFERAIAGDSVSFVGEPLRGMQIMGVLETRSLDFRNIVMLSMNERIFPRRQYTPSFIPDTLRRGFGMSTMDFQESIFAYYFYRLIARAENVCLLYDARTVGGKSSEMSRYIAQLLYVYNGAGNVSHSLGVFPGNYFEAREIAVVKTPEIMEKLGRFTTEDPTRRLNLSASAINDYIRCPLKFYLRYVEGYREEDEAREYMDASTLGHIVHSVAQRIYEGFGEGRCITSSMLLDVADTRSKKLERLVTEQINEDYLHLGRGNRTPLFGESLAIGRVIVRFLRDMLSFEAASVKPFTFLKAEADSQKEFGGPVRFEVAPGLTLNMRRIIDRIDRLDDGTLRFVDYKTGKDPIVVSDLGKIVMPESTDYPKALFQLLLYCNIYRVDHAYEGPIQPIIYSFSHMAQTRSISPLKVEKEPLLDYRTLNDRFLEIFRAKILEMFNPEVPFRQAEGNHSCTYCSFKEICKRKGKNE